MLHRRLGLVERGGDFLVGRAVEQVREHALFSWGEEPWPVEVGVADKSGGGSDHVGKLGCDLGYHT